MTQHSDTCEAGTRNPMVSSQAPYHYTEPLCLLFFKQIYIQKTE